MKVQFENKVMSSLLMFVDHEVTQKGEAFTNTKSNFFKIDSLFKDYHVYAAPFKQMVSDVSVTGGSAPTVMTGIYVDGDGPLEVGNSGFDSINFMVSLALSKSFLSSTFDVATSFDETL